MQDFLPVDKKSLGYGSWINSKNVVRVNSFSKHYGLAEYRIGWVIAHKKIIGGRYSGIVSRIRGLMGNAPRAANDVILKLIDYEIQSIKENKYIHPLKNKFDDLNKKYDYIVKRLTKNKQIEIIHKDACFNLTIKVNGFRGDIDLSKKLMNKGTLIMPCEGYGYDSKDTVMRITFAERWDRIRHSIGILEDILKENE
jgi:aspartate/methionine/tyrosine aminotransferase